MPALIKPEGSSHWYTRDGQPCYEVPCKSKPGEMRATSLRDARTMDLLPSVTSILSIKAKPGLEAWKQEQIFLAAQTLERLPDESDLQWVRRVTDDAFTQSRQAAGLGSAGHKAIKMWIKSRGRTKVNTIDGFDVEDILDTFITWYKSNVGRAIASELPFACVVGYGGCTDFIWQPKALPLVVVTDFKTKATKPKEKIKPYSEWGMQLAAYGVGVDGMPGIPDVNFRLQNVVISTTEPGRSEVFDWTAESRELFDDFQACQQLWCREKKYWPQRKETD